MEIEQQIDEQRWLMNNGLFNDNIKNNIYMYGSLVHPDVTNIEVMFKIETKTIDYVLYVKPRLIKNIAKYNSLRQSQSLWSLFRLKRLLKKQGNLDLRIMLERFIKDYAGNKWNITLTIKDESEYVDGYERGDDKQNNNRVE